MLGAITRCPGRIRLLRGASSTAPRPRRVAPIAMAAAPQPSRRVRSTDDPCIVSTKRLVASVPGTISLAQGIVHWAPPEEALAAAAAAVRDPPTSGYGPDEGLPALREALREKLTVQNGLRGYDVHITAGANQAFTNVTLALLDPEDGVILWRPFYFNHQMAIQMAGGAAEIEYGPCDPATFHPDLDWLEARLSSGKPPKAVVLVNPCNPTGVLLSKDELDRAAALCEAARVWLVLDNTYEDFLYDGRVHYTPAGPHIVHIFSFSKAYGMMGWRVGYIAFPDDGTGALASQLLKVQDTIPICAPQVSQKAALGALAAGSAWVAQKVESLESNRAAALEALAPLGRLGAGLAGGEGAIYLWARLPEGCEDDGAVVEWLVKRHRVCLIPGSACGCPGHVRVGFANMGPEDTQEACERLRRGLEELVAGGMAAVHAGLAEWECQQPAAP